MLGFLASAPADLNPATVSATKKDSVSLCASLFSQLVSGRSLGWSESSKNQGPVLALEEERIDQIKILNPFWVTPPDLSE